MEKLTLEERIELITSISNNGGDAIGTEELADILTSKEKLYTYDGFEPSGQLHISQGILKAINVNKMITAGFTFRMLVADWFAYLNNKIGGNIENIQTVGKYLIENWKASGMDLDNVEFLWTSKIVQDPLYWELVMKIAKRTTLKRVIRTTQIMGRSESDELSAGMIFYPCMQVADIFHVMKAKVTQLGLDQQKANILAREIGEELGYWKPVIISHGVLQGLLKPTEKITKTLDIHKDVQIGEVIYVGDKISVRLDGTEPVTVSFVHSSGKVLRTIELSESAVKYFDVEISIKNNLIEMKINTSERQLAMKMSKSIPDSAIFMTDSPEEVKRKIMNAYCPEGIAEENPILEYCKQIIFQAHYLKRKKPLLENGLFELKRDEKYGGYASYKTYEDLENDYLQKKVYPLDLKVAVIEYLNELLIPVREHFENDKTAAKLLGDVKSFGVTR